MLGQIDFIHFKVSPCITVKNDELVAAELRLSQAVANVMLRVTSINYNNQRINQRRGAKFVQ